MPTLNLTAAQTADSGGSSGGAPNDAGRLISAPMNVDTVNPAILSPGSHASNQEWSVAARFTGVTVPAGATIVAATLRIVGAFTFNAAPDVVRLYASFEDADDAIAFAVGNVAGGSLSHSGAAGARQNRPRTTAVATLVVTSVVDNDPYTFDVTAGVQEVIDRPGWASGQALVAVIDTHEDTTTLQWQDFDGPELDITYTVAGAEPALPFRTTLGMQRVH